MASIRKRGKSWLAEVRLKNEEARQSFPTKGEAQTWAAETERKIRAGQGGIGTHRIVRDALERYERDVSPKKPSHKWESIRLTWLGRQTFATKRMSEIATPDLVEWRDARLKVVSGSTVNRDFNILSHVFTIARDEWHWITHNPCAKVKRPPENAARTRRVSADELALLYQVAGHDPAHVGVRVMMAFEFCIETAMRGGEALGINGKSIRGNTIHLPMTKNGDPRDVPLSEKAAEILARLPEGFDLNTSQKNAMFRKIRAKAALPDLNFHDSRHEAICRLAKVFDVLDLARITGHRDINELLTYYHADAHALATRLRKAVPRPTP